MVQQLTGKGGGGGGAAMVEEKPKARLGVDMGTRQLLVTGPEFIYNRILEIVTGLDKPEKPVKVKTLQNMSDHDYKLLQQMFGGKLVPIEDDGTSTESGGAGAVRVNGSPNRQTGGNSGAAAAAAAIQSAVNNRRQAGNRGGRGGNGRGGRGGR